jgi:hypothetical protein
VAGAPAIRSTPGDEPPPMTRPRRPRRHPPRLPARGRLRPSCSSSPSSSAWASAASSRRALPTSRRPTCRWQPPPTWASGFASWNGPWPQTPRDLRALQGLGTAYVDRAGRDRRRGLLRPRPDRGPTRGGARSVQPRHPAGARPARAGPARVRRRPRHGERARELRPDSADRPRRGGRRAGRARSLRRGGRDAAGDARPQAGLPRCRGRPTCASSPATSTGRHRHATGAGGRLERPVRRRRGLGPARATSCCSRARSTPRPRPTTPHSGRHPS